MRRLNGFDRLSTEEELHQVLAVLQEFSRNGWVTSEEGSAESLWADAALGDDDSVDAACLTQLAAQKPELKN